MSTLGFGLLVLHPFGDDLVHIVYQLLLDESCLLQGLTVDQVVVAEGLSFLIGLECLVGLEDVEQG